MVDSGEADLMNTFSLFSTLFLSLSENFDGASYLIAWSSKEAACVFGGVYRCLGRIISGNRYLCVSLPIIRFNIQPAGVSNGTSWFPVGTTTDVHDWRTVTETESVIRG